MAATSLMSYPAAALPVTWNARPFAISAICSVPITPPALLSVRTPADGSVPTAAGRNTAVVSVSSPAAVLL